MHYAPVSDVQSSVLEVSDVHLLLWHTKIRFLSEARGNVSNGVLHCMRASQRPSFGPSQSRGGRPIESAPILRRMSVAEADGWHNIDVKRMEEPGAAAGPEQQPEGQPAGPEHQPAGSTTSQKSEEPRDDSKDKLDRYLPPCQPVVTQYAPWCNPNISLMTVDYIADLCSKNAHIPSLVPGADPKKDLNWVMVGADPITHRYQADQYFKKPWLVPCKQRAKDIILLLRKLNPQLIHNTHGTFFLDIACVFMQGVLDDVMWYGPLLGWTYQMKEPFSIKIDGDTSYPMPKAALEVWSSWSWDKPFWDLVAGIEALASLLGHYRTTLPKAMQVKTSEKSQTEKNTELITVHWADIISFEPLEGVVTFMKSEALMNLPMHSKDDVVAGNYQWFMKSRAKPSVFTNIRQEFFIYFTLVDGDKDGPLQAYKICGGPTPEKTFKCGPKEKIIVTTSGWDSEDVYFKLYLGKNTFKVHKVIYATKDGLDFPMAMELRSLNHKPGCNPRQCHLLYCPEVPGDVTVLMAKRVTYKDRWDPEARQDAYYKGETWEREQHKKTPRPAHSSHYNGGSSESADEP